jgi:hypothetical protein
MQVLQLIRKRLKSAAIAVSIITILSANVFAQDTIEQYIIEYPNQEQVKMMTTWLNKNEKGTFQFTGLVDPTDDTVVTPQATVDYGYNWFSISEEPAIIHTPQYDQFFSVSIFDMKHNVPEVIVNPDKPILIKHPGQNIPEGDFVIVELETDQGLILTRMVVVDNMKEVRELSKSITMEGGKGNMQRSVQGFSPEIEGAALDILATAVKHANPDISFGKKSGDVGAISLAAGVMLGQLGTPSDTVRYGVLFDSGKPFDGNATYTMTVPSGIIKDDGYFSITIYDEKTKLLIPNAKNVYDRTTYTSEQNSDGTYTITISPKGEALNGIPTSRKNYYGILRAYSPVKGADLTVKVEKN